MALIIIHSNIEDIDDYLSKAQTVEFEKFNNLKTIWNTPDLILYITYIL